MALERTANVVTIRQVRGNMITPVSLTNGYCGQTIDGNKSGSQSVSVINKFEVQY